jgi:alpha-galactosidase
MNRWTLAAFVLIGLLAPARLLAQSEPLAAVGDAAIYYDDRGLIWHLKNSFVAFTLAMDRTGALRAARLANPETGRDWTIDAGPDTAVVLADGTLALGPSNGLAYEGFEVEEINGGLELRFGFRSTARRLHAIRHYALYPGSPAIETWTTFDRDGDGGLELRDLNVWQLGVPNGQIIYVNGQEPDEGTAGVFTRKRRDLAAGQRVSLASSRRSSEQVVPWFAIENNGEQLFGGIMWSGSWAVNIENVSGRLRLSAGVPAISTVTTADRPIETPHGFFGVAANNGQRLSLAMRLFMDQGVRQGRPFQPLTIYNSWFVHGAAIDEPGMHDEIERAAQLGFEVFVLDAGWYEGSAALDQFDFASGLGSWTVDPWRFPAGLADLATFAHDRGLKFGLWVEPERVALDTVDQEGLAAHAWLAAEHGLYDPSFPDNDGTRAAQICLAHPDARQWVLDHLFALLDQVRPDYLKWDNNTWINCDRAGHGHGASDGNFAHTRALYDILAALRERYPAMQIENCSGGGNRLDFGMARLTDVAWMDDRTAPASHVRHNLEGLGTVFPPSYLFSFVLGELPPEVAERAGSESSDAGDPLPDLSLLFRSRMPGVLGLGDRSVADLDEALSIREVQIYRRVREIQMTAGSFLLTEQAEAAERPSWDAIEQLSPVSGSALIFAFQNDAGVDRTVVVPVGLQPDARYEVTSIDYGLVGEALGSELMDGGIEIIAAPLSAAHILILRVLGSPVAPAWIRQ